MAQPKKAIRPDQSTPQGWLQHHRGHGKPFFEVKIGEWNRWRCSCGERFHFTAAQREASPDDYVM